MTGANLVRGWFDHSPFARKLDMRIERLDIDEAELLVPYDESLATYGDVVHGGAIATAVDVAATLASWSGAEVGDAARGATIGMTVDYVRAARGSDLRASAKVVRRGGTVCFNEVEVKRSDGEVVAKALVTYKVGA
jgi:uncharacterized protein (TIGR00369 family)